MDMALKRECEKIRSMTSEDAATWMLAEYPVSNPAHGRAYQLLPHRSWKRADQIRLADYYFQKIPYASARPYEAFASFMSVHLMLRLIARHMPLAEGDRDLLDYHLRRVARKWARTARDEQAIREFLREDA